MVVATAAAATVEDSPAVEATIEVVAAALFNWASAAKSVAKKDIWHIAASSDSTRTTTGLLRSLHPTPQRHHTV
jgi:hypothetical protein